MDGQRDSSSTQRSKPGFFYGYIIVLAGFIIMTTAFGANFCFGVFLKPLVAEFGWGRAVISLAYSLMMVTSGLMGILIGRLADMFGPRILGTVGGLLFGLSLVLMSFVDAIWQVYLIYGIMMATGLGSCWPVLLPTVARWFVARRGLMTGIVVSGIGLGTVIVPPLANWLISIYYWRTSYIILGIIALVLITVTAQFLKRNPYQIGQLPYGEHEAIDENVSKGMRDFDFRMAFRTRNFLLACSIYFCWGFSLHTIMVHIVAHVTELGISSAAAASILALIGGISIVGRVAMGIASDRLGVKLSLISDLILMFVALFWLQIAAELWMFYLFTVVFGLAYGGGATLQTLISAELFGLRSLGVILACVTLAYTSGGAVGPLFSGYMFDLTGDYYLALLIAAFVAVAGCVLALVLKSSTSERKTN